MITAADVLVYWAQLTSDVGVIIAIAISSVIGALSALLGLGFGIRKAIKYATGPGFQDDTGTWYNTKAEADAANDFIARSGI